MRNRKRARRERGWVSAVTGLLLVACPPVGLVLLWKRKWPVRLKYALSAATMLILALAAVVMYRLVLRAEKILNRYWGVIQ